MIIAGIDIGSNATRLTIAESSDLDEYHHPDDMIKKYRFPCRLGDDVFKDGLISSNKLIEMHSIFSEIEGLLKKYKVKKTNGVATSAFRDAKNGDALFKALQEKHPVPFSIISGGEEAKLMSEGLLRRGLFTDDAGHLHVDIGGGSLELSCYFDGAFLFQESLDLGTLRLIENTESGKLVSDHEDLLKLIDGIFDGFDPREFPKFKMHGTGGNFKRLGTLRKHSLGESREDILKRKDIRKMIDLYKPYPGHELSEHTPIKKENAALIMPSLLMIDRILEFWPAKKVKVSKLSLSHVVLDKFY
ncbi:MAG: hypothetical protein ACRBBP_00525 [Bdellovibrionales bacterium]